MKSSYIHLVNSYKALNFNFGNSKGSNMPESNSELSLKTICASQNNYHNTDRYSIEVGYGNGNSSKISTSVNSNKNRKIDLTQYLVHDNLVGRHILRKGESMDSNPPDTLRGNLYFRQPFNVSNNSKSGSQKSYTGSIKSGSTQKNTYLFASEHLNPFQQGEMKNQCLCFNLNKKCMCNQHNNNQEFNSKVQGKKPGSYCYFSYT